VGKGKRLGRGVGGEGRAVAPRTKWPWVRVAERRHKAWISILKRNRNLETNSFVLKDASGVPIPLAGPHIAVEDLVPLIPASAYRAVTVGA